MGLSGTGAFSQSGGADSVGYNLNLGYNAGSSGTYFLSGGGQLFQLATAYDENVGVYGAGTIMQSGGINDLAGQLVLGYAASSSGTYVLSANGVLYATNVVVGYAGSGSFMQPGGTQSVTNELVLGYAAGSSGTYNLSGSGLLFAYIDVLGYSGTGTFTQSGGTNSVGTLVLGQTTGAAGTYNLNGGLLSLAALVQGSGAAAFRFSGGTFQAATSFSTSVPIVLATAGSSGTFDTSGNSLPWPVPYPAPAACRLSAAAS